MKTQQAVGQVQQQDVAGWHDLWQQQQQWQNMKEYGLRDVNCKCGAMRKVCSRLLVRYSSGMWLAGMTCSSSSSSSSSDETE
jgi:hypothetical protein